MSLDTAAMSTMELPPTKRSERPWQVATIIAAVVAIAALGVALVALNRKTPSAKHIAGAATTTLLRNEVESLRGQLNRTNSQVVAMESAAKVSVATVTTDHNTVAHLSTCVPELDGLINGESVETGYQEIAGTRYLTSAYLSNHQQLSTYCQSLLTKETGRGGP
jgi:hypothetical protein